MVALEIEFEDEILSGIQCLASLAEPVVAVVFCPLDNLGTDMFQESFSLLFAKNIKNIVQYMEEDVVISAESHLLICRCRAHDVTVEIRPRWLRPGNGQTRGRRWQDNRAQEYRR